MNFLDSIKEIFFPMFFSVLFLIVACYLIRDYLPKDKSKINLLIVATVMGGILLISFVIQYFTSEKWRKQMEKIQGVLKGK